MGHVHHKVPLIIIIATKYNFTITIFDDDVDHYTWTIAYDHFIVTFTISKKTGSPYATLVTILFLHNGAVSLTKATSFNN